MMCKLKGRTGCGNQRVDTTGGNMMCELKDQMDKGGHYDVEIKESMQKGAI